MIPPPAVEMRAVNSGVLTSIGRSAAGAPAASPPDGTPAPGATGAAGGPASCGGLRRDGCVVLSRRDFRLRRGSGREVLVYEQDGDRENDRQHHPFFLSHRSLFPKMWILFGSSTRPVERVALEDPPGAVHRAHDRPLRRTNRSCTRNSWGGTCSNSRCAEISPAGRTLLRRLGDLAPHSPVSPCGARVPAFPEGGEQFAAYRLQRRVPGRLPDHDGRSRPRGNASLFSR